MKTFKFPGGEVHVQLEEEYSSYHTALLRNSDDIMQMLLTNDALKRAGIVDIYWTIPYVPYARQDRVANLGEPLSIKVMADLINSMGAAGIEIWDPHSDVTPALINNCDVIEQWRLVRTGIDLSVYDGLISPDAGAEKKTNKLAKEANLPVTYMQKQRNTRTGEISSTGVIGEAPTKGRHLVVDDICDGGRTFIEIVKSLPPSLDLDLYVTHGIFSKGLTNLLGYYKKIYCPNIFYPELCLNESRLVQI